MAPLWESFAWGAGLGLAYSAVSYLMVRFALRNPRLFMLVALGGMGLRIMLALSAVTLILVFAGVEPLAFVGSFFLIFIAGLAVELVVLARYQSASPRSDWTRSPGPSDPSAADAAGSPPEPPARPSTDVPTDA
jgi:hypothetical protein